MRSRVSIVEFSERMTVINFDAINTAVLEDNDWRDKLPFGVARQSEQSGAIQNRVYAFRHRSRNF